ncbi:MAG: AAA family ATPase [Chloroflexi bacterium]|nr:AAA family ATPase [Chloroflexota bacterium]
MPSGVSSARFVGRDEALSRIAVALEAAAGGHRRRLLISGPGGVGVSRLVDESIVRVARLSHPFTVLRWRAHPARTLEPYAPVINGLEAFLSGFDEAEVWRLLGPGAEALRMLLPDLVAAVPSGRGLRVGPDKRPAWVAEAVLGVLERAAERQPVLLVLEDLHVADAATRSMAVFLTRINRPARICFIATYRTDRAAMKETTLADLTAIADTEDPPDRLELGPLSRDELAQLIAGIEGERPTAALLMLTSERSGRNPLLAEEVLAARRELAGVSIGTSLRGLVAGRLSLRSAECRRVVRLLAPIGEPIARDSLQVVATELDRVSGELPERSSTGPRRGGEGLDADLRAGVVEAMDHGLVVEESDGSLALRHEMIADAVEEDLLPIERRELRHVLAHMPGFGPAIRARHALAAHDVASAHAALLDIASMAAERGAAQDRLSALELAMELGSGALSERAAAELIVETADVAAAAGQADRSASYLEAASRAFGGREDAAVLAGIHERRGKVERTLGHHDRALAEHRRAAELVPAGATLLRARVLGSLAQTLMLLGTFGEAESIAASAIDAAREAGPDGRPAEGHATCTLGIARAWGADPAESIPLLEDARDIALEIGDAEDYFRAVLNLTTALTLLHRGPEAIDVTNEAIERARTFGLETVYGNTLRGNVAEALFLTGRWAEAREAIRTALEWSPGPDAFADAAVTSAALEVESASGDLAARLLGRRLLDLRNAPDPQSVVPASRAAASFAMWLGDLHDAANAAELGWSAVRGTEDWVLASRMAATYLEVQVAIVTDARERRAIADVATARERAGRVLAEAELALRSSGVPVDAGSRRESEAQLATARAYAARLDGRDLPTVWDSVARGWERVGDPYQVARARWRQAEAALPASDARVGRAAARAPLLEAVRVARELGAAPLLRELEGLARRALITLPAVPGPASADRPGGMEDAGSEQADQAAGLADTRVGVLSGNGRTATTGEHGIAADFVGRPEKPADAAFGLSNREREVLGQIVLGRTNREIGERLFISQKTVGVHVGNILAKLGVSGRVEAAMVAVRLDLVPTRAR